MARLCLNMIVKNEMANLPRLLTSVLPYVTSYAIVDTGSIDGTPDFIRAFFADPYFADKGVRGAVEEAPFHDYAQARNAALDLALRLAEDKEQPLLFDYLLLADADMQLVVEGGSFPEPTAHVHLVRQHAGTLSYDNTRLIRRDALPRVRYQEYTHEFLSSPFGEAAKLEGLHFIDHASGSNRPDKFQRDVKLLRRALRENPNNARACFYLAETYRFMGQFSDAVHWYDRRVTLGGWHEEIWYAGYQAAASLLAGSKRDGRVVDVDKEREGIARALQSYEDRTSRLEPLRLLAKHFRETGRNATASMIAREMMGRETSKDSLFVETDAYTEGGRNELSIAGFYSPRFDTREEARKACLELATDRDVWDVTRGGARNNWQHYAKKLSDHCPSTSLTRLKLPEFPDPSGEGPSWNPLNPSICRAPDGMLLINIRRVNYVVDGAGAYGVKGRAFQDGDQILTANQIVHPNLVLPTGEVGVLGTLTESKAAREGRTDFYVQGFEDLRVFAWQGRTWATATVRDRPHVTVPGLCQIALLRLSEDLQEIESAQILAPPPGHEERYQKNWVPLVTAAQDLLLVYSLDPLIVLHVDLVTLQTALEPTAWSEFALDNVRGSSQAISVEDGYLYVAHESIDRAGHERRYLHRFVFLKRPSPEAASGWRVANVSEPFYFEHPGIEFCAGLADAGHGMLALTYGIRDAAAAIAYVRTSEVLDFLRR